MNITLEREKKYDGRCVAQVPELPGVLGDRQTPAEATVRAHFLAMRVLADLLESGEVETLDIRVSVPAA